MPEEEKMMADDQDLAVSRQAVGVFGSEETPHGAAEELLSSSFDGKEPARSAMEAPEKDR